MSDKLEDIYVQFRLMIRYSIKSPKFYYTIVYTPFAYMQAGGGIQSFQAIKFTGEFKPNPKQNEKGWLAVDTSKFLLFDKAKAKHAVKLLGTLNDRSGRAFISIHQQTNKGIVTIAEHKSINWIYQHENTVMRSFWDVTKGLNGTNPDTVKDQAISRKDCPHKIDGAIKVAEYIVDEIKRNVKSLVAQKIRYHLTGEIGAELEKEFQKLDKILEDLSKKANGRYLGPVNHRTRSQALAYSLWYEKVNDKKDWDHKPEIVKLFGAISVTRPLDEQGLKQPKSNFFHKYKGFDYFYDIWSNIHYGYVGMSVGFSEKALLLGSNIQQTFNKVAKGADTPDDITTMKMGFELYKRFGKYAENLSVKDIIELLDQTPSSPNFPYSKQTHWCFNTLNKSHI